MVVDDDDDEAVTSGRAQPMATTYSLSRVSPLSLASPGTGKPLGSPLPKNGASQKAWVGDPA